MSNCFFCVLCSGRSQLLSPQAVVAGEAVHEKWHPCPTAVSSTTLSSETISDHLFQETLPSTAVPNWLRCPPLLYTSSRALGSSCSQYCQEINLAHPPPTFCQNSQTWVLRSLSWNGLVAAYNLHASSCITSIIWGLLIKYNANFRCTVDTIYSLMHVKKIKLVPVCYRYTFT